MDGNGRWAKKRGLRRNFGHERGGEQVREILRAAHDLGIEQLTLYAFSTENWRRPKPEIMFLHSLLIRFLRSEREQLDKDNVVFKTIGELDRFPKRVRDEIEQSRETLKNNNGTVLCLALNYGSRQEILRAAHKYALHLSETSKLNGPFDEKLFESYLETAGMPELDLLIRTAGEKRISNFLLWQLSYAELYFVDVFWPDFTPVHLAEAVADFKKRERRFGALLESTPS